MTVTEQEQRCELTELPTDSCGCRQHRGGLTVQEQAEKDRRDWIGRVFIARHPGHCEVCDEPIRCGQQITRAGDYGRGGGYRHAECEEEP